MVSWDTQSDWDESVDSSGVAHESVTNTDRNDATVAAHGYSYTSPPLTNGLVGHWPLHDDSAQDLSGNDNHGTLNGGVTTGVAGRGGLEAMSFDGTDDYVNLPDSPVSISGDMSFIAWVRPSSFDANDTIISDWASGAKNYYLYLDSGIPSLLIGDGGSNQTSIAAPSSLQADEWAQIAFTRNGSSAELYVNGSLVASTSTTLNGGSTTNPIDLGRYASGATNYYNGVIYDARIYNRALSASEIQTLYEWGSIDAAQPATNGVSRYALDGDATDSWGSNDGTANGGLVYSSDAIRGQSGDFDGTDDYIDIPNVPDSNNITLSAWVKFDSPSDSDEDSLINIRYNQFVRLHNRGSGSVYASGWDGSWQQVSAPVTAGEWYHVVGVIKSNDEVVLYLNGAKVASTSVGSLTSGSTNDSDSIGARFDSGSANYYFDGHIDDVRIYDYALSPEEVFELYRWGTFGRDMRALTVRQ